MENNQGTRNFGKSIFQYINTATSRGKRNVVFLCYGFGFIALHFIWANSKKDRKQFLRDTDTDQEVDTEMHS